MKTGLFCWILYKLIKFKVGITLIYTGITLKFMVGITLIYLI